MKIFIAGNSHLTHYTKIGAAFRGLNVCNKTEDADLILIAEDTPTDDRGIRDLTHIQYLVTAFCNSEKPVILMSQVPPGFCRKQNRENLYHYPETLRIKDSYERACNPEYILIGSMSGEQALIKFEVYQYITAFKCKTFACTYEEAELAKIAVNTHLSMQVEYANRMEAVYKKFDGDWNSPTGMSHVLRLDKRIGPHAYLTPGRWQDSLHLLRDSVTLKEIEDESR